MKLTEDHRDDLVVILAGYPGEDAQRMESAYVAWSQDLCGLPAS